MKLMNGNQRHEAKLELPGNLSLWTTSGGLLTLTLDATQNVQWQGKAQSKPFSMACRPQMLLTLLTYCYSTGIYATQDILQAIQSNPTIRYICAHNYPDYAILRKFRRSYRSQLEQALRWVMLQAWAGRLDRAEADFLSYEWFQVYLEAGLDAAVQSRLELAIVLDGVEND